MKKLLWSIPLFLFTLVASCSDSDDYENLKNHPIVGEWYLYNIDYQLEVSDDIVKDKIVEDLEETISKAKNSDLTILFDEEGHFSTSSRYGDIGEGTFKISKDKLIMSGDGESETFYFKVDFNTMTVSEDQTDFFRKKSTDQDLSKIVHFVEVNQYFRRN